MRRMRLGDKSIERDAARLRALLGPRGGTGGTVENPIFVTALGGIVNGTTDRIWGGKPSPAYYWWGVDILQGIAYGCFKVITGTVSLTATPLLALEDRANTGLWIKLTNTINGYSPVDGDYVESASQNNISVSPDGMDLKVAAELATTINLTASNEILEMEIYSEDIGTILGCRILGWIIS